MAKVNIPDPAAAAERVKGIATDLAAGVSESYRKATPSKRYRVGFVGGWVLLSLVALLVAFWTHEADARAAVTDTPLVGRVVSINNTTDENWTDVTLTLDGGWVYFVRTIRPGQNVGILVTKFAKDGLPAPADLRPRWVQISCGQVDDKIDLTGRR
jgi:hypothetical protein